MDPAPNNIPRVTARVVLVTGASSGIGEATVREAAARGDHVVLVGRAPEALARVADDCAGLGAASTLFAAADVSDDAQVASAVEAALARHGRLDVVVSCAGVVAYGRIPDVPVEVFDQVLATNLNGPVNLARHVLPVLRDQRQGSLVLVGSLIGLVLSIGVAIVQFWPDYFWVLTVAGIFFAGQFLEGNILQPKLVGSSVGLHPVWLMFALFAFASLFGFLGMMIAVPAAAAVGVLVRFALKRYLQSDMFAPSLTVEKPTLIEPGQRRKPE